jgi:type I restriction enzyme S subunit
MQETQKTTIQEFESKGSGHYKKYPEYESPDGDNLRDVPAHWENRSFQYWAEKKNDKGNDEEKDFITLEHINSVTGDLADNFEWEKKKSEQYYLFEPNDVLFGKLRPYLRKYYQVSREGCCGTDLMVLRPSPDVESRFLYYFLHSEDFIQFTDANSHGVKMPRTSWTKISAAHFRLPPIEEQNAIVEFLDKRSEKIDQLIERKKELISLIKEKKVSIITQTVTQGLDPDVDTQDTNVDWLGLVPEHWEINIFRRFCSLNQGLQIAQSERFDNPSQNRYKYLTVEEINSGEDYNSDYIEDPPENVICDEDDVLLARTGATGEVISDFHGAFHNNFFKINFDRGRIEKGFLVYYLKNELIKKNLLAKAGLTTVPDLNHRYFLDTTLLLPPKEEQREIIRYLNTELEEYDEGINKIREGIDILKEYRTALITEAVTGQIDVRGEV